jgi:hypothetical protein
MSDETKDIVLTRDQVEEVNARQMDGAQDQANRFFNAFSNAIAKTFEQGVRRWEIAGEAASLRFEEAAKRAMDELREESERRKDEAESEAIRRRMEAAAERMASLRKMMSAVSRQKADLMKQRENAEGAEADIIDCQMTLLSKQEEEILKMAGMGQRAAKKAARQAEDEESSRPRFERLDRVKAGTNGQ